MPEPHRPPCGPSRRAVVGAGAWAAPAIVVAAAAPAYATSTGTDPTPTLVASFGETGVTGHYVNTRGLSVVSSRHLESNGLLIELLADPDTSCFLTRGVPGWSFPSDQNDGPYMLGLYRSAVESNVPVMFPNIDSFAYITGGCTLRFRTSDDYGTLSQSFRLTATA
jgi:hypothetical protein